MEEQKETNWLDFDTRMHDPALGRFNSIDILAEDYSFQSPYAYAVNNPIKYVDVDGMGPGDPNNGDLGTAIAVDLLQFKHAAYNLVLAAVGSDKRATFVQKENGDYTTDFVETDQSTGEKILGAAVDLLTVGGTLFGAGPVTGILAKTPAAGALDDIANAAIDAGKQAAKNTADEAASNSNIVTNMSTDVVENVAEGGVTRIQNAANRINKPVTLVGSRAGGTAGPASDFDYVIEGLTSNGFDKIKNSLPGARSTMDNLPRRIDIFKGKVDQSKPFITVNPKP